MNLAKINKEIYRCYIPEHNVTFIKYYGMDIPTDILHLKVVYSSDITIDFVYFDLTELIKTYANKYEHNVIFTKYNYSIVYLKI